MYSYALLTDNNFCHTVLECSEERTDIVGKFVELDSYDINLVGCVRVGSEWERAPEHHMWDDALGQWVKNPLSEFSEEPTP